jgi:predicted dinucleotide-binding enzyme
MKIGVIGCGAMGTALGRLWALAGHEVTFSFSRSPDRLAAAAARAGEGASIQPLVAGVRDAVEHAEALLIAVRWAQLDAVLRDCEDLRNKVLIDCTLPMNENDTALTVGLTQSGAEVIQLKTGAHVVKAFNTVPSELLTAMPLGSAIDLFFAGDDMGAKQTAAVLISDAGFHAVDCGPLAMARHLEPLGLLMGQIAYVQEPSPVIGYRLVR